MEFHIFLRSRLKSLNMSYSDLERLLTLNGYAVTKSTVAHWASGRNKPPVKDAEFVRILARSLKMSVAKLWTELDYVSDNDNETIERISDIASQLPRDKQQLVLQFAEMLAQNSVAEGNSGK